ncbi:MAG: hypothetical protein RR588_10510, partial [Solibacillus sp.]
MSSPVVIINKQRIFIKDIRSYELDCDAFYFRNEIQGGFFHSLFGNPDDLWEQYSFDYIIIEMKNGVTYQFFSDKEVKVLIEEMDHYFKERNLNVEDCFIKYFEINFNNEQIERETEEDKNLEQAIVSFVKVKKTLEFATNNVLDIASRLDHAFGVV